MTESLTFENLESFRAQALNAIEKANTGQKLEKLRINILGRKSSFQSLLSGLSRLSLEQKRAQGPRLNSLRHELEEAIESKRREFSRLTLQIKDDGTNDLTLPGLAAPKGRRHPLSVVGRRILNVFEHLGFRYVEGREIELDENNFTLLNIPEDHPARDLHDTLYIKVPSSGFQVPGPENKTGDVSGSKNFFSNAQLGISRLLLRTHTTPVWVPVMRGAKPPYRVVTMGRVFRSEAVDATHLPGFSQIDAFYVDKSCSMNDLTATLEIWVAELFGPETPVRFRPSYFPFTEPSCEVEIGCFVCLGKGCAACKKTGWIEMLGAGMIHPSVIQRLGHDPDQWRGFAFGLGIERVAMALYGVPDIRFFYENDVEFIRQFPG
ncbi:MAG: phenylalanine--tRNA ligase subunit alpha [Elusimicrobia bacterium]|nr:phenylalanine--tRNA ligase subunit alpha [Elusimicrobiota bacterium]